MRRLRTECAWKAGQTHESLVQFLGEETEELVEAIGSGDIEHMREELGDVLLQVVFHAVIAEQAGEFTLDDVARGITEKMRRRNPHVFDPASIGRSPGRPSARRGRDRRAVGADQIRGKASRTCTPVTSCITPF